MRNLAVITARGGSKRIPCKNIKEFCGKPIIAYSIRAAIESGIFDVVMVSTDSEEIAEISRKYGATIPFMRSVITSDDYATTMDVVKEVINEFENRGEVFDTCVCIYPTAPFVDATKLRTAIERYYDTAENADALFPMVRFSYPPQRCYIVEDGLLKYKWPENYAKRSQDLEPYYHDAGQFYIYNVESVKSKDIQEWNIIPYEIDELEVQDIDTVNDWKIAEIKYKMMISKGI